MDAILLRYTEYKGPHESRDNDSMARIISKEEDSECEDQTESLSRLLSPILAKSPVDQDTIIEKATEDLLKQTSMKLFEFSETLIEKDNIVSMKNQNESGTNRFAL